VIQAILGHDKLDTTARYTRVATGTIREVMSPLDRLTRLRPNEDETKDATKQKTKNETKDEPPAGHAARLAGSKLEVGDIFRRHGPAWRQANAGHVSLGQLKVMSAIESCRTAALGGHVARCEDEKCGYIQIAHNSCLMGKINAELAISSAANLATFE
jgi:hypothetical protein